MLHTLRTLREASVPNRYRWSLVLCPLFWLTTAAEEAGTLCDEIADLCPTLREPTATMRRWAHDNGVLGVEAAR
eukprot:311183-Prorocentrum_lima.AAC.1